MTETTYYTPETLEEFKISDSIEINTPMWVVEKGQFYSDGKYIDNWQQEFVTGKILILLEDWYYAKESYGDIDLTKRVRVKQIR